MHASETCIERADGGPESRKDQGDHAGRMDDEGRT
jgi:hypothetical protein